jgi:exportin-7
LELLCKQLYESQDASHRAEAEKALVGFQNAPDTLSKCQLLLDRGDSCYAQLLAATTLTKLVSRSAQGLSLQQRVDIRKFAFKNFLWVSYGFVVQCMKQIIVTVVNNAGIF